MENLIFFDKNMHNLVIVDFVIFCGGIKNDKSVKSVRPIPDMFIMSKEEIISAATKNNGNYWLNESEYKLHKDKWEKIGFG